MDGADGVPAQKPSLPDRTEPGSRLLKVRHPGPEAVIAKHFLNPDPRLEARLSFRAVGFEGFGAMTGFNNHYRFIMTSISSTIRVGQPCQNNFTWQEKKVFIYIYMVIMGF